MKKLFLIGLVAILCACASKPVTNNGTVAGMDLDTAIKEAATQMEIGIPSGTMVALVSVASPSTAFSTQVLTRLESAIVGGRKLIVVDRANLDKVRAEQGFQLSGDVSDESAKAIGQLLGAGAIVTGSLTDLGDVYSLTLKAINIETATVAVSYLADLTKTTRIETLLATRDGAGSGGTSTATASRPASTAQTVLTQQPTAPVVPPSPTYKIGDPGPAGGVIFYDKGNRTDGWRYLEVAPSNTERSAVNSYNNPAPIICDQLIVNGFTDWYLPNLDELMRIYASLYLNELDNFKSLPYFSSEMAGWGNQNLKAVNFKDGSVSWQHNNGQVRAIRRF
jgi:hypothetical protein